MEQLLVFLGDSPQKTLLWGIVAGEKMVESGRLPGIDAIPRLKTRHAKVDETVVILPGEQAILRTIPSPPKNFSKFQSAAALILEDEISEPIENLHYVTHLENDFGVILALRQAVIDEWMAAFKRADIGVDILTVDIAVVLGLSKTASMLRGRTRTIIGGQQFAFACENDTLELIGPDIFGSANIETLRYLGKEGDLPTFVDPASTEWVGTFGKEGVFAFFSNALAIRKPINLLKGKYQPKVQWKTGLASWQHAGMIAAGLGFLFLTKMAVSAWRDDRIASRFTNLSQELHNQSFPGDKSDPVSNARNLLASDNNDANFVSLSRKFSSSIEEGAEIQIDRMGFNKEQGRYSISIRGTSDTAIEELRANLSAQGLRVRENGGYRQSRGYWVGELLLEVQ